MCRFPQLRKLNIIVPKLHIGTIQSRVAKLRIVFESGIFGADTARLSRPKLTDLRRAVTRSGWLSRGS